MNRILVLFHLLAVIIWIGGMFFAHVCLRPVANAQLPPPQRLKLLAGVLERFFVSVGMALILLWGSGIIRLAQMGAVMSPSLSAMVGIAAVMTAIFFLIVRSLNQMNAALASEDWPTAGAKMATIRRLVLVNLVLGIINVTVGVLGA